MEIVVKNSQRSIKVNKLKIERLLKKIIRQLSKNPLFGFLKHSEISILLIGDKKMKELNLRYRNKNKTTDVLSFPLISENLKRLNFYTTKSFSFSYNLLLGDIVINLQQANRQALERGLSLYEEVHQLLIHGFLHLLGYDHEKNKYQAVKMKRLERKLLELTK
jgi:probable rRNA maturation factor